MTMVRFTGQSARDSDAEFLNSSRLINCYLESAENVVGVRSVLGSTAFADLGQVFLRAMQESGAAIWAACGGRLYEIDANASIFDRGQLQDGDATISGNNGALAIAAGGALFVYDGVVSAATGAAFTAVGSVTFLGQRTIYSEAGGRRFGWSALADASSYDALDFASAEGRDDTILRVMAISGRLVVFKETSREIWYETGAADSASAFARIAGGVIDTGLAGYSLLTELDQGAFFIGDDGIAYVTDGVQQKAVSNRAVETDLANSDPQRCFFYEDEGHKFACVTFSDRAAWCYDISSGMWHEREAGSTWPVVETVKLGGEWFSGTDLGKISKMERVNEDDGAPLIRKAVSSTFYQDGRRFRVAELEMFARVGRAHVIDYTAPGAIGISDSELVTGSSSTTDPTVTYREPQASLRLSKDRGLTWGREYMRGLGLQGDYDKRLNWRSLGQFRHLTAEISWSDPIEVSFSNEMRVRLA